MKQSLQSFILYYGTWNNFFNHLFCTWNNLFNQWLWGKHHHTYLVGQSLGLWWRHISMPGYQQTSLTLIDCPLNLTQCFTFNCYCSLTNQDGDICQSDLFFHTVQTGVLCKLRLSSALRHDFCWWHFWQGVKQNESVSLPVPLPTRQHQISIILSHSHW